MLGRSVARKPMDNCNTVAESSSAATSVFRSTPKELPGEEQPVGVLLASSQNWTAVENTTYEDESSDEDDVPVRPVLPGRNVFKFTRDQITLLEKIGEGGQGTVYTALFSHSDFVEGSRQDLQAQVRDEHDPLHVRAVDEQKLDKYDCSLRDAIDKRMKKKFCNGRPFPDDLNVLLMIIRIALGMRFLHENNIIHGDLKADNIFVDVSPDNYPISSHIGDFDVSPYVIGTKFWRAPEVLQALKDKKCPVFTPKADVYSFAMTCYEILTGGIPFEGFLCTDYDVVLSGNRPELPSNLNPKMKGFINRCWHQDPKARPTFNEIVVELKKLHRELVTGSECVSKVIDGIIDVSNSGFNIYRADAESCVRELKVLLEELLVKYIQADFIVVGLEMVEDMVYFQSQFGLRSYKELPILPLPVWFMRQKLRYCIQWKMQVFGRIMAHIGEAVRIIQLMSKIMATIDEDFGLSSAADISGETFEKSPEIYEDSWLDMIAWLEEYGARVLPDERHGICRKSRRQRCDLCKHGMYSSAGIVYRELFTRIANIACMWTTIQH